MDFHDFDGQDMYFDTPLPAKVEVLLNQAADLYGQEESEAKLVKAFALAPKNLSVLVAMYRYYYYQHRLNDALIVADIALQTSGEMLNMRKSWEELTEDDLGEAVMRSMGLVRFYFLALKGSGYLLLRMGKNELAVQRLKKVVELDPLDRLGASVLLRWAMFGSVDDKPKLHLAYVNESRLVS